MLCREQWQNQTRTQGCLLLVYPPPSPIPYQSKYSFICSTCISESMMHRVSWCIYLLMLFNAHHFTYEETEKQRNYEAGWGQRRVCTFRSFNSEALSWSDSLPQTSSPPFLQNGGKPGSHFGCTQSQITSPCPVPTPWTLVAITDIEHCVSLTCTMYLCMYTFAIHVINLIHVYIVEWLQQ